MLPAALAGASAAPARTHADPALLKALARAFRWHKMLDEGHYASISELAAAENIERGYLGSVLKLTLLAPCLVEAIVEGWQGIKVSLPGLMHGMPTSWPVMRKTDRAPVGGVKSRLQRSVLALREGEGAWNAELDT